MVAALVGCWLATSMAAMAVRAAEEPVLVGDYGDVRHIKVLGALTFGAAKVQGALLQDPDVLAALHPKAPLEKLEALLCDKLKQGYYRAGFAAVKVQCRRSLSAEELLLHVEEGQRYTFGDIRIVGASEIPLDELKRAITTPCPDLQAASLQVFDRDGLPEVKWFDGDGDELKAAPLWPAGEPARLDRLHLDKLRRHTASALAGLGFYFARFEPGISCYPPTGRVELQITIAAEGPRARLAEIEISGHTRHTREQIFDYLKLGEQSDIAQQDCLRLEHELFRSGRFTQASVTMVRPATPEDPKVLRIALVEHPRVSLLSVPLSREEQAFLRLREWLIGFERRGDDLVIASRHASFPGELIVSPRNGLLLSLRDWRQPEGPFVWSVLASNRELGLYALEDRRKIVVPWTNKVTLTTSMGFTKRADEPHARNLKFGVNWQSLRADETGPGWELATRWSPANFLHMAHEQDTELAWSGDVLTTVCNSSRVRVHGPTGALLEWTLFDDQGKDEFRAAFAPGLMAAQIATIESALPHTPNEFHAQRPVTSALHFIAPERLLWRALGRGEPALQTVLVARKLLDRAVLAPLDGQASAPSNAEARSEPFVIPREASKVSGPGWDWALGPAAHTLLTLNDALVPRNSWLATILRSESLQILKHGEHSGPDYIRLYGGRQAGPVCHLAGSYLLGVRGLSARRLFAAKGLERLSTADFRTDYQPLLSADHLLGQCLSRAAAAIQDLTVDEAQVFDDTLLQPAVQWLRQEKQRPLEAVLPEALDLMWEQGLQARIEALLRDQARPPEAE
jgi:hypothetical protein